MNAILYLLKWHLVSVYFFIKILTKKKKQVLFLSRQFNNVSLNYQMVIDELEKNNIKYKCICKKVDSSVNDSVRTQGNYSSPLIFVKRVLKGFTGSIKYYFSLYRQMWAIASSTIIIVDGYNLPVSLLKHKKGTKVIQMWHALAAIKKFGFQAVGSKDGVSSNVARILKMHANYDYVLSGSEGMNKYFAEAFNTPIDKVLAIGTPTTDYMKKKDDEIFKRLCSKYPSMENKINILYVPTFRNDMRDNTAELVKYVDFDKCNLILAKHPKEENKVDNDKVICLDRNLFKNIDVLKAVDYVITDYSAIMIDACLADKKILLYLYDFDKYNEENGVNIDLLKEYPSLSYKNAKELMDVIINNNYNMKEYTNFKNKYTTNINGRSTDEIVNLIKRCLDE